jgi:hypothetical protein
MSWDSEYNGGDTCTLLVSMIRTRGSKYFVCFACEMANIPKSNQSLNSSRNFKSYKQMGQHGPPDIPEAGSGSQEEQASPADQSHPP